jgi:hypothetical protein
VVHCFWSKRSSGVPEPPWMRTKLANVRRCIYLVNFTSNFVGTFKTPFHSSRAC